MCRIIPFIIGISLLLMGGCRKEDPQPPEARGKLVVNIGLDIREHPIVSRLKSTAVPDSFAVVIYHAGGSQALAFENLTLMPDTVSLAPGDYYVTAHSGNDLPAVFENPFYSGTSDVFAVSSNTVQNVNLTCSLANTKVTVEYTDPVVNGFDEYSTTVATSLGSLLFAGNENRAGYFKPLAMDITVELTLTGVDGNPVTKQLSGTIPDPLPARHYQVIVNAAPDQGSAVFQILLDDTPIVTETIEITGEGSTDPVTDPGYGSILITEIMANPSALSDTEGEYIEIYNNSQEALNLKGIVLTRDETNSHTVKDSIVLQPGEFYVMARTETASDATNTYIYGSAITLPNTGAILTLRNPDTAEGPGEVIFSLDYGSAGFPEGTGASIILNPLNFNAADGGNGSYWCLSQSSFNTGDKGTPGAMNDKCD